MACVISPWEFFKKDTVCSPISWFWVLPLLFYMDFACFANKEITFEMFLEACFQFLLGLYILFYSVHCRKTLIAMWFFSCCYVASLTIMKENLFSFFFSPIQMRGIVCRVLSCPICVLPFIFSSFLFHIFWKKYVTIQNCTAFYEQCMSH